MVRTGYRLAIAGVAAFACLGCASVSPESQGLPSALEAGWDGERVCTLQGTNGITIPRIMATR
jgi:hypothetical protein